MSNRSMVVSLIGRPNVGKSSLFNRLMRKQHKAITFDAPGVTRDRHYGLANFKDLGDEQALDYIVVDTGGFYPQKIDEANGENKNRNVANQFFNIMADQAKTAIDESDLVLFVVDCREGILPFDQSIASYLRAHKKKFWLLANKYDSDKQAGDENEFYNLGLDSDELFVTSAAHGLGISTLRDKLFKEVQQFAGAEGDYFLQKGVTPRENVVARLAIIGAPNAGKSTLLNGLIGAERALVSDIAGTTVDPIEGFFDLYFGTDSKKLSENSDLLRNQNLLLKQYAEFRKNNEDTFNSLLSSYDLEEEIEGQSLEQFSVEPVEGDSEEFLAKNMGIFEEESQVEEVESEGIEKSVDEGSYWRSIHLIDTAGIRKQGQIDGTVEAQSVYRSLRCITESDIVVYMVDATKGMGHQDRRLIDIALDKGKSVIIALNKMDLLKGKFNTAKERQEWLLDLRAKIPWLDYCDIIPISAKYQTKMGPLKEAIKKTILVRKSVVPTGELNRFVLELVDRHPVVLKGGRGKRLRVKYCSQVRSGPPTFLFFTNKSKGIPENYRSYFKNGLRRAFHLKNTPIHLIFRSGSDLRV